MAGTLTCTTKSAPLDRPLTLTEPGAMSSDGSGGGLLPDPGAANSPSSKSATAMSADDTVHSPVDSEDVVRRG